MFRNTFNLLIINFARLQPIKRYSERMLKIDQDCLEIIHKGVHRVV